MPTYYGEHKVLSSKWNYPPKFAKYNQIDLSVPAEYYSEKALSSNCLNHQPCSQKSNLKLTLHDSGSNIHQQFINANLETNQSQLTDSIDAAIYQMENIGHDKLKLFKDKSSHNEMEKSDTFTGKLNSANSEAVKLNEAMQNEINSIMNNVEQYINAIKLTEPNSQVVQIEAKDMETQPLGLKFII